MYKVLIADDEIWVSTLIRNSIDWTSMNLEIVGETSNGLETYEKILELRPDIVITDIRMPGMNGIELMEKIRLAHLNVEFIILSGFDSFAYAQAAIQYHAVSFILKPLDELQLQQALVSAIERLCTAHDALQTTAQAQSHLKELRDTFLLKTLQTEQENPFPPSLEMINQKYNCHFHEGHFVVLISHMERLPEPGLLQQIKEVSYRTLSNYAFDSYILEDKLHLLFIINTRFSPLEDYNRIAQALFVHQNALCRQFKICPTMAVGSAQTSWTQLHTSYTNAYRFLYNRVIDGPGRLYQQNMHETLAGNRHMLLPISRELQLTSLIETFETQELERLLNHIVDQIVDISHRGDSLFAVLEQIVKIYHQTVSKMYIATQTGLLSRSQYLEQMEQCNNISEIKLLLQKLFVIPLKDYHVNQTSQETNISSQIKLYVAKHYQENIRLSDIAEHLYRNSSYIGFIFKRDTGISFSEYLASYRINIAKSYLLDTRQTMAGIAEAVGFCDMHHFSKTFKNLVGMTPAAYRKKSVR